MIEVQQGEEAKSHEKWRFSCIATLGRENPMLRHENEEPTLLEFFPIHAKAWKSHVVL